MAKSEITLDGQNFPLKPPSVRSSLVKLCNHEIIPAYATKTAQVRLSKRVISELLYVCAVSSLQRTQPVLEIVESVCSHQNTLCRIVNNSNEPIALSKDTAIALAMNVHSNNVLEMHHLFENDREDINDDISCECDKCVNHDLQTPQNKGKSGKQVFSRGSHSAYTTAKKSQQSLSAESGHARSHQDRSKQARSADKTGESRNVNIRLKCKCNTISDLTCDQFDFSADLQAMLGEINVNTVNSNTTNADILNNIMSEPAVPLVLSRITIATTCHQ